jgi:hypothetical protein
LLGAPLAHAASYDSLVERGQFYLRRGSTYGADAVRSLEAARDADPRRSRTDPALQSALAHAYVLTSRHSEAFWLLQEMEQAGPLEPAEARLRERLLGETGVGRVRVRSAVPVGRVSARLQPTAETRLDVAGRKTLERLNELLARGISPDAEGVTLLAPEGAYAFSCATEALYAPREPLALEVWAGDEVALRLVPLYPPADGWSVAADSRSVTLRWRGLEGVTYRLYRTAPAGDALVYEGEQPGTTDTGLGVGASVEYRLELRDPRGELVAASLAQVETLPPVTAVAAGAEFTGDLTVRLTWALGPGAADRVRILRRGDGGGEQALGEVDATPRGEWVDGPFLPEDRARDLIYRVEAWLDGVEQSAAAAEVVVAVPPRVQRVTAVGESIDRGVMVVGWETLPREGLAEGYAVYRQRSEGTLGVLVGRVRDPFAREFEYPVEDALDASGWRHFVVPYLGDRMLFDPEWLHLDATPPEAGFGKRARSGYLPPDLGLSWDRYPGARNYVVVVGDREDLVDKPYVEIDGLQNNLAASENPVEVFALGRDGTRVPLLRLQVEYLEYPRSREDKVREE